MCFRKNLTVDLLGFKKKEEFMKILNKNITFTSKKSMDFIDLTEEAKEFVNESQIDSGLLVIHSKHTTMAIRINESEKGIMHDLRKLMKHLVPKDAYYRHNDLKIRTENLVCDKDASDCINGHSHCTHFLMGNSETISVVGRNLSLGRWQRIFALELDCSRKREVEMLLMGE